MDGHMAEFWLYVKVWGLANVAAYVAWTGMKAWMEKRARRGRSEMKRDEGRNRMDVRREMKTQDGTAEVVVETMIGEEWGVDEEERARRLFAYGFEGGVLEVPERLRLTIHEGGSVFPIVGMFLIEDEIPSVGYIGLGVKMICCVCGWSSTFGVKEILAGETNCSLEEVLERLIDVGWLFFHLCGCSHHPKIQLHPDALSKGSTRVLNITFSTTPGSG